MVALWSAVNIVASSPGSMGTRGMVSFGAIAGVCFDVATSGIGSFLHAVAIAINAARDKILFVFGMFGPFWLCLYCAF